MCLSWAMRFYYAPRLKSIMTAEWDPNLSRSICHGSETQARRVLKVQRPHFERGEAIFHAIDSY